MFLSFYNVDTNKNWWWLCWMTMMVIRGHDLISQLHNANWMIHLCGGCTNWTALSDWLVNCLWIYSCTFRHCWSISNRSVRFEKSRAVYLILICSLGRTRLNEWRLCVVMQFASHSVVAVETALSFFSSSSSLCYKNSFSRLWDGRELLFVCFWENFPLFSYTIINCSII